jgi:hypothetical protein
MTEDICDGRKRPMRSKIYEIQDECGQLDRLLMSSVKTMEIRHIMRDKLKVIRGMVNAL